VCGLGDQYVDGRTGRRDRDALIDAGYRVAWVRLWDKSTTHGRTMADHESHRLQRYAVQPAGLSDTDKMHHAHSATSPEI
jgi:hypothetical protein